ncbi:MAG: DsbA family protein, partial [Nioella sp.]
ANPASDSAARITSLSAMSFSSAQIARKIPCTSPPRSPPPAFYAIITAQKAGGGDLGGLVHGILRAIWAEEKDIAESEVIRAALSDAGFAPDLADKGMLMAAEEYARNLEDAAAVGVFGSPFYVVDGAELFWGHDRLDDLDRYLSGDL